MNEVNIFKESSPIDLSFLYCSKLTITAGIIITLVRFNKCNKASLIETLTHLVIQMNLPLVVERYRHIANTFD